MNFSYDRQRSVISAPNRSIILRNRRVGRKRKMLNRERARERGDVGTLSSKKGSKTPRKKKKALCSCRNKALKIPERAIRVPRVIFRGHRRRLETRRRRRRSEGGKKMYNKQRARGIWLGGDEKSRLVKFLCRWCVS